MEGTHTPHGCGGDDINSKEVFNEKDDVYAEHRKWIKMILSSYDDTDSEDSQINLESEDEIIDDMEQVAVDMKSDDELDKSVEDFQVFLKCKCRL